MQTNARLLLSPSASSSSFFSSGATGKMKPAEPPLSLLPKKRNGGSCTVQADPREDALLLLLFYLHSCTRPRLVLSQRGAFILPRRRAFSALLVIEEKPN